MLHLALIVEAVELKKTYMLGKIPVEALRGVSLKVKSDDFLAILGPSGSGKSTMLNLIGSLDKPTAGTLRIDVVNYISLDEKDAVLYHYVIINYLVISKGSKPKAQIDADDLKWVPFNEVEEYNLTETFRVFFRRNRQRIENASLFF